MPHRDRKIYIEGITNQAFVYKEPLDFHSLCTIFVISLVGFDDRILVLLEYWDSESFQSRKDTLSHALT